MNDFVFCNDCGILLPTSKLAHHRNSRTRICEIQGFTQEVKTGDIYLECPCGSFIQQRNITTHCATIRHREFMEQYPGMVHHPIIQLMNSREYIDGGRIYEVNTETLDIVQEGRDFSYNFFRHLGQQVQNQNNIVRFQALEPLDAIVEEPRQEEFIPNFFMEFIRDSIESSNKKLECVICYETITRDNIFILPCFHMICCECQSKMKVKQCPICREEY